MAQTVLANSGLNDLSPGSVLLTLLQAAASEDFQQYYQMLQIIRNYNLDTTTNTDLDNRATEYGLTRYQAKATTGLISILRPAGFTKIATTFYAGFRSAISGDTTITVNNAAAFTPTGYIVVGRGTPNQEFIYYKQIVNNINYYTLTLCDNTYNNSAALQYDHTLQENIVLIQNTSDIIVRTGINIQVPATGETVAVNFVTTVDATILAGEAEVDGVDVMCNTPGSIGNIGVQAINGTSAFPKPPFVGAQATNYGSFSNGRDRETDTQLRNRIKNAIQAISQSTQSGISYAIQGLVDPVTAKRVISNNIILPQNVGLPVKVYIDDGTGFEPTFGQQGQEVIVAAAIGSETRVPIQLFPIVKAQLETLKAEPYDMSVSGLTLSYFVGDNAETITFDPDMFYIPTAVTAYEMVGAINSLATLIEARTSGDGAYVVIDAISDISENIQINTSNSTANASLNFPINEVETFYLYKNDKLLSKDGVTAYVSSPLIPNLSLLTDGATFLITVDGKNVQTVTFHASDFPGGQINVATMDQVVAIVNANVAGAVATNVGGGLQITSNTTLSVKSKIKISGTGTANTALGFAGTDLINTGLDQDYILNTDLGIVELVKPLAVYDLLTAGTRNTRGFITASISDRTKYSFSVISYLLIYIDGGSFQTITIPVGAYTAPQLADIINAQLLGGRAVVRSVGPANEVSYIEIRTNTFAVTGSIRIASTSTANAVIGFATDSTIYSIPSHTAYQKANNAGPYTFVNNDTLVVVIDNDASGHTFIITMSYGGTVTAAVSTSLFSASGLSSTFVNNSDLVDFWLAFKSGANTATGVVSKVDNPFTGIYRYTLGAVPSNYAQFTVNDELILSGFTTNPGNNGSFLVTGLPIVNVNQGYVITAYNSNPPVSPSSGQRFLISPDAGTSADIISTVIKSLVISNPTGLTPANGDAYLVAPAAGNVYQTAILGRYTASTDPAVVAIGGNRYLVLNAVIPNTDPWYGHIGQIAQYNNIGTPGWFFYTMNDGDVVFSVADNTYYQYAAIPQTWTQNTWGGCAGQLVVWNAGLSAWNHSVPYNHAVAITTPGAVRYQYLIADYVAGSLTAQPWVVNSWGGLANQIAVWSGLAWSYTMPSNDDLVTVVDQSNKAYQYKSGTASWSSFAFYLDVSNPTGVVSAVGAEAGTTNALICQRRQITGYNANTGALTTGAFGSTPTIHDIFVLLPSTATNVVTYFNNSRVTSLASSAFVELADGSAYPQISSRSNGSDGYVQITGGQANNSVTGLNFSTNLLQGLQAYNYYTGLIKLVSSTIYGDEADLTTYPGVGAAGIKFQILPPTVREVGFVVSVSLSSGVSLSAVTSDIQTQIINYCNNLGVFQPVILSQIVSNILKVSGVTDVKITDPLANIVVKQNEIARTKASIITISNI